MGFFSDYNKAKEEAEREFERKHPIIAMLSKSNNNQKPKKKSDKEKRMKLFDLSDEEKDAVLNEDYEPEDFEDDEIEEDDYYFDE